MTRLERAAGIATASAEPGVWTPPVGLGSLLILVVGVMVAVRAVERRGQDTVRGIDGETYRTRSRR